jgi:hypothetical protein
MPCDTYIPVNMTPPQRRKQIDEAIDRLNKAIEAGQVTLVVDKSTGAVGFKGDWQRDGVSDSCAFRKLTLKSSMGFKRALAKAETMAGRKVNEKAVAAGVHMHGDKFYPGHK